MAAPVTREPDLLRFLTAGSVDDGKSTLIGRLLYDAGALYDDHIESLRRTANVGHEGLDFSLVTDGLRAEREQGITIDVAYRYFLTARRRFIIADAPGHEQYTRNMATAASGADLAVLLIDAHQGVVTQSKRHAFICSLLGVPRLVVAVNKMDMVSYDEARFREIEQEYREFVMRLGLHNLAFIPVSALRGDNVVKHSEHMPWYSGQALLQYLEEVYVAGDRNLVDFRLPVQRVVRAAPDFRGYSGRVASGVMRAGEEVLVLPSGFRSRISTIDDSSGAVATAGAGRSVTITLQDEIDIGRGDMIVHPGNVPREYREIEAMVVWTGNEELLPGTSYWLKHATQWVRARCEEIHYCVDPNTLRRAPTEALKLNDIGRARFSLFKPILADQYQRNRVLGAFIIVSQRNFDTVGAATIVDRSDYDSELKAERMVEQTRHVTWHSGQVTAADRAQLLRQRPATIWLTGLSGAGKSTVAFALERKLLEMGQTAYVLDGDNVRHNLNRDLGFSPIDRAENIRRIAEVARLMNDAGLIVITAFISPYIEDRKMAREIIGAENFMEVHLSTVLQVCESRDPKGLYKRARSGEISGFTGVSAPYEPPLKAELSLDTAVLGVDRCVDALLGLLAPKL